MKIKEIFTSVQGEGIYTGCKQLFIRFCGCNLNCRYCDTDFDAADSREYTAGEILEIINTCGDCASVSLTGGEPLLHADFIKEFAPQSTLPLYLETNGTLPDNLQKIIDDVTYIAADIKLPSISGIEPMWEVHDEFLRIASKKDLFAKVVFDAGITNDEISRICGLCSEHNIELVLQPVMRGKMLGVEPGQTEDILNSCLKIYRKVRLIPQTHKFLGLE